MKVIVLLVTLTAVFTANGRDQGNNFEAQLFPHEPGSTDITDDDQIFPNGEEDKAFLGETHHGPIGPENQNITDEVQQTNKKFYMRSVSDQRASMNERGKKCIPTLSCTLAGGHCVNNNADCKGALDPHGCKGNKKCKCCIPVKCLETTTTTAIPTTTTPANTTTASGCENGWHRVGSQCIKWVHSGTTWPQAQAACQAMGNDTNLAQPDDINLLWDYMKTIGEPGGHPGHWWQFGAEVVFSWLTRGKVPNLSPTTDHCVILTWLDHDTTILKGIPCTQGGGWYICGRNI